MSDANQDPAGNRWLAKGEGVPRGPAYDARIAERAAEGGWMHGEADLVCDLLGLGGPGHDGAWGDHAGAGGPGGRQGPPTVLDAGCGTGRVAIELHRRGLHVIGVDLDPSMLAQARLKAPGLRWVEADLTGLDLGQHVDLVVAAGNVLIFLTPGTEAQVTSRLAAHLNPGGHLVAGFSLAGEHLTLPDHHRHCAEAGLVQVADLATWEGAPYVGGDYVVSIHRLPPRS